MVQNLYSRVEILEGRYHHKVVQTGPRARAQPPEIWAKSGPDFRRLRARERAGLDHFVVVAALQNLYS